MQRLSAEDNFLLRSVRGGLGGEFIDHNKVPHLDWSLLCDLAKRHQVQALVHEAIKEGGCENRLPADVRNAFLLEYHRTGMRNGVIEHRVGDILRETTRKGIEVMLLKGAVLAYSTYARPEHRGFGDVDLLVHERDFAGLREILEGFGYRTSLPELCDRDLPRYAHCVQQIRFHSRKIPHVEVHFRLLNTGVATAREPAWDDAQPLDFAGAEVRHPSPERFLLHLCLHAQQHAFALLRLFVDIAVWQRSHSVDTERFVALARRHHLATAAYYALTYTVDLLGLPDSETLRGRLRPPAWKQRLFERLWRDQEVRSLKAFLGAMEGELPRAFLLGEAPLREKAVFLWNVVLPPGSWLDSCNGSATRRRLRHVGRILNGARWSLLGTNAPRR